MSRSGIDGPRWCPRSASKVCTSSARSSILGVRYSTGIADSGGSRNSRRAISPHSAENPTSKRVTPVMCTRPRSIRFDQISMSGLSVSRTSADLSISQRWSVTSTPDA
ncbi:Uncharacterised protein [Mycobacterium tuberculosis]|nr:Uncharacterised protein [Mycobacterium tuberculosis]